ncbi:MAG: glycosyltransferase [Oscillospiraceae bacterium]|nr:glycosyltransferase [Oscillospiraceae bacterium]
MLVELQHILLPSTRTCTEEQLYFRRGQEQDVTFSWANDEIEINKNGFVSFDTYFNGFSIEKWAKYTNAKKIYVTLKLEGTVRVTLMRKEKHFQNILTEYVGEHVCRTDHGCAKEFTLAFDTVSTAGMYCFALKGLSNQSIFYGGSYFAEMEQSQLRPVKIALDICTFKRERFVMKNLENLNASFMENPDSFLYDKLEVFISDNAGTLDIPKLSSDKIHIVKNKNVGGSGGFTRGMIEIKKVREQKKITHILVTDDDIIYEPESIFRTCTFLSCVTEQYSDIFVGGAMLRLDTQYIQTESGAVWNGGHLVSLKNGLDLRLLDSCLYNETEEKTQFNAWWFCAVPAEVVTDTNLPIPIFIRGDDVEYGLRNIKHLALMNGICVWHEPFENKYSSALYYYIFRNRLIDNALHDMNLPAKVLKREIYGQVMNEVRLYRYKNAHLLLQGAEDFFKGVEWLKKQDGEALHQKIMAEGYKLQYTEELGDDIQFMFPTYEKSINAVQPTNFMHRVIANLTINGTKLSPKHSFNIVPTDGVRQINVYRTQTILNYDYASRKGFVTKRDLAEAKKCVARLKKLYRLIDSSYEKAILDFAEHGKTLQTMEFWEQYLGITQDEKEGAKV